MRAPGRFGRAAGGLLLTLTPVVSAACYITQTADLDADVVALSLLLVAGRDDAYMLAVHPHREPDDAPPEISVSLDGPGWTARFSDTAVGGVCEDYRYGIGPATCLRARLPEPVRPTGEYGLRGTAPLGSFTGEAVVPSAPIVVEPADTLHLPPPDGGQVRIPLRYRVDPETGLLLAEVTESGGRTGSWTERLEVAGADTVELGQRDNPLSVHLTLHALGWNYANFTRHMGHNFVPPPWPDFGVDGEGVYGYFDGVSTPSRIVYVLAGETHGSDYNTGSEADADARPPAPCSRFRFSPPATTGERPVRNAPERSVTCLDKQ